MGLREKVMCKKSKPKTTIEYPMIKGKYSTFIKQVFYKKVMQFPANKYIYFLATGYIREGELMAVMGPSAAGKSTLFNALTYRNLGGLQASKVPQK